jgi:hypothetical protein
MSTDVENLLGLWITLTAAGAAVLVAATWILLAVTEWALSVRAASPGNLPRPRGKRARVADAWGSLSPPLGRPWWVDRPRIAMRPGAGATSSRRPARRW